MPTRAAFALTLVAAFPLALAACGGDDSKPGGAGEEPGASAPAPKDQRAELEHIHGLGIDPGSGSLFVATHYGLFQAAKSQTRLQRAGESRQDVMGFSVVGPQRFIGSGHPDPSQGSPPNMGLIESRDAGRSFKSVSLLGQADFHTLRAAGKQVYGFDGGSGKLMVSVDGGRRWVARTPPGGVFDLAISPDDPQRVVVSTDRGMFRSTNAGKAWQAQSSDTAGLLAWIAPKRLVLVDGQGQVSTSADAGKSFTPTGTIGGPPSAFVGDGEDLYAALGDGSVVRSTNGGAEWVVRATP